MRAPLERGRDEKGRTFMVERGLKLIKMDRFKRGSTKINGPCYSNMVIIVISKIIEFDG